MCVVCARGVCMCVVCVRGGMHVCGMCEGRYACVRCVWCV